MLTASRFAAFAVACLGLFAAGTLSLGPILDLPVPCGGARGCAVVASHPASRVFGVPIAFAGVVAYVALLGLLGRPERGALRLATAIAGLGAVTSLGLLTYSASVIGATCPWCVVSALAMTVLFALCCRLLRSPDPAPPKPLGMWILAGAAAAALGVQAGLMERSARQPPIPAEKLAGLTSSELVQAAKRAGPDDAQLSIVVFADFWCPACRSTVDRLRRFQRENPRTVRLVYRHLPLAELRGHESSKVAAALSEIAAEHGRFWDFVDALHGAPGPLGRDDYLRLMRSLGIDAAAAAARLEATDDVAIAAVLTDMALAERLGVRATPTFLVQWRGGPWHSASSRGLTRLLRDVPMRSTGVSRPRADFDL